LLIEEIREAAYETIELAAGEAAKAALLESVEREATALREASRWRMEAQSNFLEIQAVKKTGRKNTFLAAVVGILGGLVIGAAGTFIIGSR